MPFSRETKYLQNLVETGITISDWDKDAVEKIRVSNPQSLIDTDFEYSLQNPKWEFLSLCNNYPGVYSRANEPAFTSSQITSILPSGVGNRSITVTVNTLPRASFRIGDSIVLKETANTTYVDGAYIITAVLSEYSFQVVTKSPAALVGDQKTLYTAIYTGGFYTNANIPINGISSVPNSRDAVIEFQYPHNLYIDTPITVVNYGVSAVPWAGSFAIKNVLSDYRVTFQTLTGANFAQTTLLVPSSGAVYARTEGVAVHRFFDGGVQINPGTSAPNAKVLRQTRKYFKYQSGKSTQFSSGILFRPVYEVTDSIVKRDNFRSAADWFVNTLTFNIPSLSAASGPYLRFSGGTTSLYQNGITSIAVNRIVYNSPEVPNRWALYYVPEGVYIAQTTQTGVNSITGSWTAAGSLLADAGVQDPLLQEISPNYPYYDFEITTEQYHGFAQASAYREGCFVRTNGFTLDNISFDNIYNNTFKVVNVINSKTFQVQIPVNGYYNPFPNVSLTPGGLATVDVLSWNDATVRSGLFDDQNGMFFEFDGKEFWVVRRQTTTPINGAIRAQKGSPWIVSSDGLTKFATQLKTNDYIVIQGMSYLVGSVVSNLSATVTPTYRGVTASGIKAVKTVETRVRQSDFNLDKLDGTGPSKYVLDLNRMQMVFIDYSWYGAGKIRYGIRADRGRIIYFHEIYNNNVNIKAHMRSGNLPGRFEISSTSKTGVMLTTLSAGTLSGTVSKEDAAFLPEKGQIVINNEYIRYTKNQILPNGRVLLNFDQRNAGGLTSGAKSHPANSQFISFNQNCSPALSHWGVAAIMDGEFNEDRSYLFTASNQTSLTAISADQALISLRLAPSVDYGIIGRLGERNLVNHSLLKLKTIGILTNNPLQINVRVNCEPQTRFANLSAWKFVANGSIAQYYDHTEEGTFEVEGTGGDLIASFFITPEAEINSGKLISQSFDIDVVRELTNSVLGGDFPYPDGPDVVTVSVKTLKNLGQYSGACRSRITWTEDQG